MSSGPFRSETETIRADLVRANDEIERLREERTDLQRELQLRARPRIWIAGLLLAIGGALGLGFLTGSLQAGAKVGSRAAIREAELHASFVQETAKLEAREHSRIEIKAEQPTCTTQLAYLESSLRTDAPDSERSV